MTGKSGASVLKKAVYDIFGVNISVSDTSGAALTDGAPAPAENGLLAKIPNAKAPEFIIYAECSRGDFEKIVKTAKYLYRNPPRARAAKRDFFKALLQNGTQPADVRARAESLRVKNGVLRAVFLIETDPRRRAAARNVLKHMFPNRAKDFIITLNPKTAVLIAEQKSAQNGETLSLARVIHDTVSAEAQTNVYVAVSPAVSDILNIPAAYGDAAAALEIGKAFSPEKPVISSECLGFGRLIYGLPEGLCEKFLADALNGAKIADIDGETINTANKFFENNLNLSETARRLYIHRNTLIYRLDRLQKTTGLDLRNFTDAALFKTALTVSGYLSNRRRY